MEKTVYLKDGTEISIRPMTKEDLDRLYIFFQGLPPKDRAYLRSDVTNLEGVRERIYAMDTRRIKRLVALHGDDIVADGALELEDHEWERHIGELRLIVARDYQRKGLGTLMAHELYLLATRENIEDIVVKMLRPQASAQGIFKKLGFKEDATFRDYVKDISGKKQDLIVMRCDLKTLWKEMEDYLAMTDWQRTR